IEERTFSMPDSTTFVTSIEAEVKEFRARQARGVAAEEAREPELFANWDRQRREELEARNSFASDSLAIVLYHTVYRCLRHLTALVGREPPEVLRDDFSSRLVSPARRYRQVLPRPKREGKRDRDETKSCLTSGEWCIKATEKGLPEGGAASTYTIWTKLKRMRGICRNKAIDVRNSWTESRPREKIRHNLLGTSCSKSPAISGQGAPISAVTQGSF
ncbi:hypothetical protein C8T65DRAFT_703284, partial [Cerioporus squamosus]